MKFAVVLQQKLRNISKEVRAFCSIRLSLKVELLRRQRWLKSFKFSNDSLNMENEQYFGIPT